MMSTWRRSLALRILDRCVLRPSRHELDSEDLIRFEFNHERVRSRSEQTEAYVFTNSATSRQSRSSLTQLGLPPRHLVLKFPGTGGRAERSSEAPLHWIYPGLLQADTPHGEHVEVWTWNAPGYGRSSPPARLSHQIPFAEDFAKQVVAHRCGPETILWLAGNSLGCITALSLGSRLDQWQPRLVGSNRVGLWCRNPPDLDQVILRIADRYFARQWMSRITRHLPDDTKTIAAAAQCQVPAVFLASQHDSLVPLTIQSDIHQAYAGEHQIVVLEGLDHDSLIEEQHVSPVQSAANWLLQRTAVSSSFR